MACLCDFWALCKITDARQLAKVLSKVLSLLQKCIEQTLLLTEEKTVSISEAVFVFCYEICRCRKLSGQRREQSNVQAQKCPCKPFCYLEYNFSLKAAKRRQRAHARKQSIIKRPGGFRKSAKNSAGVPICPSWHLVVFSRNGRHHHFRKVEVPDRN